MKVLDYAGFDPGGTEDVFAFHRSLPGYEPTPLINLLTLAQGFGLGALRIKDEAHRFGTKAFKALGASYAIHRYLQENPGEHVFCTATDGNHGMAVAWSARIFEKRAEVFMPRGTVPARIRRIEGEGARVTIVDGGYDETVRTAAGEATKHGWVLIQDTSWDGYAEIPALIMEGYLTMFFEMEGEIFPPGEPEVDVVFLQVGVGSWAASAVMYLAKRSRERMPK
ncbi:pyridoxal-phosphate dependent enzyme, partial [bacterium]|nr:pyridoxal-phosphate dependent enzyme [bacterium]